VFLDAIAALFQTEWPPVYYAGLDAIGFLGLSAVFPAILEGLARMLAYPDGKVRVAAAVAASRLGDATAPLLVRALPVILSDSEALEGIASEPRLAAAVTFAAGMAKKAASDLLPLLLRMLQAGADDGELFEYRQARQRSVAAQAISGITRAGVRLVARRRFVFWKRWVALHVNDLSA
jgi:hypothetical protein